MADNIDEIFEIQPITVEHPDGEQTVLPPEGDGGEDDIDFQYVRANHYQLAQQASEAVRLAIRIATASERPDAVKELSGILKNAAEINRQLLLLNKDRADTKKAKKDANMTGTGSGALPSQISNDPQQQVVFTGTSADLNKLLAEKK